MSTRVYVGHLSRDANEDDLRHLFHRRGRILAVTIKNGFGFVEFEKARDAEDAVYDLKGKSFMGESLVIELARGNKPRREDRRDDRILNNCCLLRSPLPLLSLSTLYVARRFPTDLNSWDRLICAQDIKDLMRKAGEVTFADLSKDFDDQAVVEFASESDMRYALKSLDGEELRGKPITLRLFDSSKDSAPRDAGRGGGGGGRDRDHGRNRDRWDRDFERGHDRRDRDDRDRRNGGYERYHDRRDRASEGVRDGDRGVHRRDRRRSRSRSRSPRVRRERSRHRSRDRRRSPSPEGRETGRRRHNRSRSRSRD
ncbi:hypothetical protein KVV02_000302 [Mortierella alpina]|uniref:RRM domain-containing protein n=1 Tax=Mortierella alpina TaxID=64518 RepID=A0A9P8IFF4_MORAP|nr:hypothetical protein KVV02_000302 [Mortierella alpina]